ncbi:MAG TPA: class I SAM-dependent methyltransferase [Candidatus Polarisedimenticolaceae bacterium]
MSLLGRLHGGYVHERRTTVLRDILTPWIPPGARVLDVGCGDGLLAERIGEARPDVAIEGVEVLVRPEVRIPVRPFDGLRLPYPDGAFDAVLLVDVVHHAEEPEALLLETARVSRGVVLIKDHTREGFLAGPTLRFMDRVGNARHGVDIPGSYWPERVWRETLPRLGFEIEAWTADLPLYPAWAAWWFGRSLHFAARLAPSLSRAAASP